MPFGAIYGALFFVVVALWLPVAPLGPVRYFLALLGLAVGLALLLRRDWARWTGALLALGAVVLQARFALLGDGVAAHLILLGAAAGLVLLLIPASGSFRRQAKVERTAAPRFGRALGATALIATVGIAATLWLGRTGPHPARGSGADRSGTKPAIAGLPARVRWSSFGRGLERARVEGKPVLLTFIAQWCGYCQKMDRTTWKDPDVLRSVGDVVMVRVDAEERTERDGYRGTDLASRYGVLGFPTLVVLGPDGREVSRTSGYLDPRQLIAWLDRSLAGLRPTGGATEVKLD